MEIDQHQILMNAAYDLWKKNTDWDKDAFFDRLDYPMRLAVALGNLNYQVENGGFGQWHDNGYAETHYGFLTRQDFTGYPQLQDAQKLMRCAYVEMELKNGPRSHNLQACDLAYYKLDGLDKEMNDFITEVCNTRDGNTLA